jgi:hypothetical protein
MNDRFLLRFGIRQRMAHIRAMLDENPPDYAYAIRRFERLTALERWLGTI